MQSRRDGPSASLRAAPERERERVLIGLGPPDRKIEAQVMCCKMGDPQSYESSLLSPALLDTADDWRRSPERATQRERNITLVYCN